MPDHDWWQALWPDPAAVVKAMGIKPEMTVVDLGCGYGYFTAAIARRAAAVIGLDLDPGLLALAKAACFDCSNCTWITGDAMQLSKLVRMPVDYVLLGNTFHGVPDKTGLARKIAAVLAPGGYFGIINWHALPREKTVVLDKIRGPATALRLSPDQTREAVEPAGFVMKTLVEFPPYHYGIVFQQLHRNH